MEFYTSRGIMLLYHNNQQRWSFLNTYSLASTFILILTFFFPHVFYFFIYPFLRGIRFFKISFKDIAQCSSTILKPNLLLNPILHHEQPADFKSPAQKQVVAFWGFFSKIVFLSKLNSGIRIELCSNFCNSKLWIHAYMCD